MPHTIHHFLCPLLSTLTLALSFNPITWFSIPIALPVPCPPLSFSLSLSLTLSLPIFGLILSSLISFIPSNPHLFLSRRRGRERESFSTGKLHPVCWGNLWKAQREKDDWRAVLWTKQNRDWYREKGFGVIKEKGKKLFLVRQVSLFLVWSLIKEYKKIVQWCNALQIPNKYNSCAL